MLKKLILLVVGVCLMGGMALVLTQEAWAAVPKTINVQGKITNADGSTKANEKVTFKANLGYDVPTAGDVITGPDGIFNAHLDFSEAPAYVDFSENVFLGIYIDNGETLIGSQLLDAVGYAFRAEQLSYGNKAITDKKWTDPWVLDFKDYGMVGPPIDLRKSSLRVGIKDAPDDFTSAVVGYALGGSYPIGVMGIGDLSNANSIGGGFWGQWFGVFTNSIAVMGTAEVRYLDTDSIKLGTQTITSWSQLNEYVGGGDGGGGLWGQGTSGKIYYNDGNVGVGAADPGHKLHVVADNGKNAVFAEAKGNNSSAIIGIADAAGTSSYAGTFWGPVGMLGGLDVMGNTKLSSNAPQLIFYESDTNKKSWFLGVDASKFWIAEDSTATTNRPLTILEGGNVGIGTPAPTATLDVAGKIKTQALALGDADNSDAAVDLNYLGQVKAKLGITAPGVGAIPIPIPVGGVYGEGPAYGVKGSSAGIGVQGIGTTAGGSFESTSGFGVRGGGLIAVGGYNKDDANVRGFLGMHLGSDYAGVRGILDANTEGALGYSALVSGQRVNYGVYGQTSGSKNYAGYFHGGKGIRVNGDYYGRGHMYLYAYEGDRKDGTAYIQARDNSGSSDIDLQFRTQKNGAIKNVMKLTKDGNAEISGALNTASIKIGNAASIAQNMRVPTIKTKMVFFNIVGDEMGDYKSPSEAGFTGDETILGASVIQETSTYAKIRNNVSVILYRQQGGGQTRWDSSVTIPKGTIYIGNTGGLLGGGDALENGTYRVLIIYEE